MEKIRLGISACLLGEPVRFDGGHQWDRFITDTLGQYVEFVPVCPESECGRGAAPGSHAPGGRPGSPPPGDRPHQSRSHATHAHLGPEKRVAELEREDLRGFIFKSKSPSSGMERVRVYNETGQGVAGDPGGAVRPAFSWSTFPSCRWRRRGGSTIPSCGKTSSSASSCFNAGGTSGGQTKTR